MNKLSPLWLRASLLGSVWGTLEIVLGSFLHNIRLPFTGTILASIGVSILVAGQYIWNERGLIWRAGLVCALMKSISPSAVILGPMVGILSETLVLELFTRISNRTLPGFIMGGGIAVCLPFLQMLVSLLITYGFNIARIYFGFYEYATKTIGRLPAGPYDVIIAVFTLTFALGIAAAFIGIIVGKKTLSMNVPTPDNYPVQGPPRDVTVRKNILSVGLLSVHILSIPVMLFIINNTKIVITLIIVAGYIAIMIWLYPGAWGRFKRVGLWLQFGFITLLAGLLLGNLTAATSVFTLTGIIAGAEMILRACFIITVFNVISIELRNPKIVAALLRGKLSHLGPAMEVAFEALPMLIATLGKQARVLNNPIATLSELLAAAKSWLEDVGKKYIKVNQVYILTGKSGCGKSVYLNNLVSLLESKRFRVGGILSPRNLNDHYSNGYDVINILSRERVPLCRKDGKTFFNIYGQYHFFEDGIKFGCKALSVPEISDCDLVIIDEIGPFELGGNGWSNSLDSLLEVRQKPILLVIRETIIEEAGKRWNFEPLKIWNLEKNNSETITDKLLFVLTDAEKKTG